VQGKPCVKQSQLAVIVEAGAPGTAGSVATAGGIATTSSVRANVAAALRVSGACAARRYTRTTANVDPAAADANAYGWATAENVAFAVVARRSIAAATNAVAATAVIAGGAEVAIRAARTAGAPDSGTRKYRSMYVSLRV
jgi:hypothetical protein